MTKRYLQWKGKLTKTRERVLNKIQHSGVSHYSKMFLILRLRFFNLKVTVQRRTKSIDQNSQYERLGTLILSEPKILVCHRSENCNLIIQDLLRRHLNLHINITVTVEKPPDKSPSVKGQVSLGFRPGAFHRGANVQEAFHLEPRRRYFLVIFFLVVYEQVESCENLCFKGNPSLSLTCI